MLTEICVSFTFGLSAISKELFRLVIVLVQFVTLLEFTIFVISTVVKPILFTKVGLIAKVAIPPVKVILTVSVPEFTPEST